MITDPFQSANTKVVPRIINMRCEKSALNQVSIPLEEGWKGKPRPAQGCGCDKTNAKRGQSCELERFFRLSTIFSDVRDFLVKKWKSSRELTGYSYLTVAF